MGKAWGVATLIVLGIIAADIWTHPTGTQAVGSAVNGFTSTAGSALLGVAPKTS